VFHQGLAWIFWGPFQTDPVDSLCVEKQKTLRFYRLRMNHDMTPELCFEFCLGAGLDLFGLVLGEECRCGASLLNKDVWEFEVGIRAPDAGVVCLFESKDVSSGFCMFS